ncbi:MAG: phage tail protein [Acidimicrobiia bacterium]
MSRRPDWLVGQLPVGLLEDDFFRRFVQIFQDVADTLMDQADNVPHVVDPTVAPPEVVRYLGSWIGVRSIDAALPVDLQRHLVRGHSRVMANRGTRQGLLDLLELLSGQPAEVEDPGGIWREGDAPRLAPVVRVRVASTGWVGEDDFVRMVREELPAQVGLELVVGGRQVWPPSVEDR